MAHDRIQAAAEVIGQHPLWSCDCCASWGQFDEAHPDSCPVVDGELEHTHAEGCSRDSDREVHLARSLADAGLLATELQYGVGPAFPNGVSPDHAEQFRANGGRVQRRYVTAWEDDDGE